MAQLFTIQLAEICNDNIHNRDEMVKLENSCIDGDRINWGSTLVSQFSNK